MPRTQLLSIREKGQIDVLRRLNYGYKKIAKSIDRSKTCVKNYLKRQAAPKPKTRQGRPPKLSARTKARILRLASNSAKTSKEIRDESGASVSPMTIRRVIHSCPHMRRAKLKRSPFLTKLHKQRRCEFARREMTRDWSSVNEKQ